MRAREAQYLKGVRERNRGRKHIRVSESLLDWDPSRIEQELNPGTSNSRQSKALHKTLHLVIEQELSERQREAAKLYYFEHLNGNQIAKKLGLAPSTVYRTLTRAENSIRNHLKYCLLFLRIAAETEEDDDDD